MHTRPIQVPRRSTTRPTSAPGSSAQVALEPERVRVVRFDRAGFLAQLPEESLLRVDVNGCLAGAVRALGDAPRELGVGWAFVHGFFEAGDALGHVTVRDGRVSIMVDGGEDLDRLRLEAVGWTSPSHLYPVVGVLHQPDRFTITEEGLARLVDLAFQQFRGDGGRAGFVHAAVASADSVHCVARDLQTAPAVAKVMGWTLLEGRELDARVLVVHGVVDQDVIRAAARLGMAMVVTDMVPTATAVQVATRTSLTVVGKATSRTIGLFVDGGHVLDMAGHDTPNEPES